LQEIRTDIPALVKINGCLTTIRLGGKMIYHAFRSAHANNKPNNHQLKLVVVSIYNGTCLIRWARKDKIDTQCIQQLNAALPSHPESGVMCVISLLKNGQ
jgi:hypothetical protein